MENLTDKSSLYCICNNHLEHWERTTLEQLNLHETLHTNVNSGAQIFNAINKHTNQNCIVKRTSLMTKHLRNELKLMNAKTRMVHLEKKQ